uniref:Secreted protein n=1 Tax=Rhizophora mucronata TaxID=61149 RepID=A0A2P2MF70_RHIMU
MKPIFEPSSLTCLCFFSLCADLTGITSSESSGQICFDRALFIWNMFMESTPKRAFNRSSQIIFLLFLGSCKSFSLM